jgi:hypothetical protein
MEIIASKKAKSPLLLKGFMQTALGTRTPDLWGTNRVVVITGERVRLCLLEESREVLLTQDMSREGISSTAL